MDNGLVREVEMVEVKRVVRIPRWGSKYVAGVYKKDQEAPIKSQVDYYA